MPAANPPSDAALDRLLEKQYIVGAAFDDETETVRVFVSKKCPRDDLDDTDIVPATYGGYPTDVTDCQLGETDGFELYSSDNRRGRYRPLESGVSECHEDGTAGTGAVLARVTDPDVASAVWADDVAVGDLVRLSNYHVYVGSGGELGDAIYQPSPHDDANPTTDHVGSLAGYVPVEEDASVDVAARTTSVSDVADPILPTRVAEPESQLSVWKRGRTTETTAGTVIGTGVSTRVKYGEDNTVTMRGCIIATDMSEPGDSGSPVFTNEGELLGLVFAGSPTHTIISPATVIESQLGVEIVTDDNPL